MATTPYTGFTSSNLPATVTTTPATFQTPSVVSPSPINTNATFDQIAAVTQPVPSFTSQSPVINPAITTGIVNRTNEQIVADQQAALANSVEQQNQNSLSGEIQKYLGLSGTPGFNEQKAAEQATLMQSNDVTGKAAAVKGIIDKINANKVLAQIGGTATNVGGLTQGQYTADIESKNLLLGAQLLVAQGQYDSARDAVTQAIDMKYAPQEARYNALLKYYDVNAKALGDKGAQMKELTTAKLADIAEKKAADKAIEDLLVTASQVAPADVMARAKLVRERGGGAAEVAAALGQYGGDYWGTKLKIAQLNKLNADAEETRAKVAAAGGVGSGKAVDKTTQAKFLLDTIAEANSLSGASGRSKARRGTEAYLVGATDYTNLESKVRTLKTNLLTLATDPEIKKFFGPQMTEADVRNMQAAATTLDTESQSPKDLQKELERAQAIFQKFAPEYKPSTPTTQSSVSWAKSIKNVLLSPTQGGNYGYQDNTQ